MADKAIGDLNVAPGSIDDANTLFVVQQSGAAYKVTGHEFITALGTILDGHGGVKTIVYTPPVAPSLTGTMVITLADDSTTTVSIQNGKGISSIAKTSTAGLVDTYTITYNDSTTSSFTVSNGAKGDTGDSWYVWIKYAGSQPTQDSDMGDTPDNWIGIYSGTEDDPSDLHYTDFDWFEYKGEKGDTGDPATVVSQSVGYLESSSGTVAPSGSWTTTIPSVTPGDFLWTRTQLAFNDGTTVTAYSVSRYGIDGSGSVSTVNNVSPDSGGNIALTGADIPLSDNQSIQTHVADAEDDIDALNTSIDALLLHDRKVILIGDSYGLDTSWWTGWQTAFNDLGIYTVYKSAVGGSGFVGDPNVNTFLQQLQNLSVPNHNDITDIVVLGGYNDTSMSVSDADLLAACQAFSAYAKANYKNAIVHFGFVGANYESNGFQATLNTYANKFRKICSKSNIRFIPNAQFLLLNRDNIFISSGNANSNSHPNTNGNKAIAEKLAEYLTEGYFDVKYGFQYGGLNIYSKNGEVKIFPVRYGFSAILPAMTYPFNSWTLIADLTATATNLLWGTHSDSTCFKFWAPVYAGGFISDALFRIMDKKIYINPLNSTSGLVLSSPGWICLQSAVSPFEAMYG